ncbi:hypothetical protein BFP72_11660 [Reichenbachiella sp. 5M10]|nr:hypothetical protein BFP72_11660 [Reichenbachiella sp. 5M10]
MNVAIVEDESPAAEFLKRTLLQQDVLPIKEIIVLESVDSAVQYFINHETDLIFLDIHLADGSSLEILEQVEIKAPIIFTTAYDTYTLEAFKLFTIDYLLKPFDERDLHEALLKLKNMSIRLSSDQIASISKELKGGQKYQQQFLVKHGYDLKTLKIEDVAYFYGSGKHLFIYTFNRESYLYDDTIRGVITKVDPKRFFRINRNYAVNIHAIKRVEILANTKLQVELVPSPPDNSNVSVTKTEIRAFKQWMNK